MDRLVEGRIDVGYDAMLSSTEILMNTRDYIEDVQTFFSDRDAECFIEMHHEPVYEFQCSLYYLTVQFDSTHHNDFQKYFGK